MLTPIRSVPALSVVELLDVIKSEGLATGQELKSLNLSHCAFNNELQSYSDLANERVPEFELVSLWNFVVETVKRPDIGLFVSMNMTSEYRGPLAKLILHSETVGQALELFVARHKWANPGENWFFCNKNELSETVTLGYQIDENLEYPTAFIERNMSMLIAWLRTMTGEKVFPSRTRFSFSSPAHFEQYLPIFGDTCQFNAGQNSLTFTRDILEQKNVKSDPYLFKLLRSNHDDLMNRYYAQFQIVPRVKQEIITALPEIMTIETLSKRVNMSRSSLYRRLKENGTSYSEVLKEVRITLAKSQLKEGSTIAQVAYSLGFTDTSAFQKWFKSAFSHPPSVLKKKWAESASVLP